MADRLAFDTADEKANCHRHWVFRSPAKAGVHLLPRPDMAAVWRWAPASAGDRV